MTADNLAEAVDIAAKVRGVPRTGADCFLIAVAEESDRIATADAAVLAVARAEGIDVAPLPDARGRLPP